MGFIFFSFCGARQVCPLIEPLTQSKCSPSAAAITIRAVGQPTTHTSERERVREREGETEGERERDSHKGNSPSSGSTAQQGQITASASWIKCPSQSEGVCVSHCARMHRLKCFI